MTGSLPVRPPTRPPPSVRLPATAGGDVTAGTAGVGVAASPTARAGRSPTSAVPPTSKEWPS